MAAEDLRTTNYAIKDRNGAPYSVVFFQFEQKPTDSRFIDHPSVGIYEEGIRRVCSAAFKDTTADQEPTKGRMRWIGKDDGIIVALNDSGVVVAFNSFLVGEDSSLDAWAVYNHYSGVHPDQEGVHLRELMALPVLEDLKPDVISGSTHEAGIIVSVGRLAEHLNHRVYPRIDLDTPPMGVYALGKVVLNTTLGPDSVGSLDKRLVRTGSSPYTGWDNSRPFPLFEKLQLGPNQAVLYMSVTKNLIKIIG